MIELFFIACLHTAPSACEERSIAYLEDVSLLGCMMQAQPQLAEWTSRASDPPRRALELPLRRSEAAGGLTRRRPSRGGSRRSEPAAAAIALGAFVARVTLQRTRGGRAHEDPSSRGFRGRQAA